MHLTCCPRTPVTNYQSTLITSHTSEDIIACHSTEYKKYAMPVELNLKKGKGKAIPLQAWTGPEGSRRLRLPDFQTIST
jgi:hypothetical protein